MITLQWRKNPEQGWYVQFTNSLGSFKRQYDSYRAAMVHQFRMRTLLNRHVIVRFELKMLDD